MNEETKIKVFDIAAGMRENYLQLSSADNFSYNNYCLAKAEFLAVEEVIEAIGGAELINEFYMYYNEVWA